LTKTLYENKRVLSRVSSSVVSNKSCDGLPMGISGNGCASRVWKGFVCRCVFSKHKIIGENNMQNYRFTTKDLIFIALMAAIGLAVKPLVKTLIHVVSTPLGIPGGTLGGGFYMMWLCLIAAMVPRFGSATVTGFIQGLVVLITGWYGSHGAASIITYALPGLAVDAIALLYRRRTKIDGQMLYCVFANLVGTYLVGILIMRLPKAPFIIALSLAIISGCIGGLLSYLTFREIKKLRLL
jgi:thiamine transporter ThiT